MNERLLALGPVAAELECSRLALKGKRRARSWWIGLSAGGNVFPVD